MKLKSKVENSNHEHALLSPSASKKWMSCPASLACEFGIPNESGQAAVNGTAMHTMSERVLLRLIKGEEASAKPLKGSHVLNHGKGPIKALVKSMTGAVLITDDFVSQVDKYVDYCRPIIDAAEVVEVEQRVNLTRVLHPGVMVLFEDPRTGDKGESALQTFGTADLVALLPTSDGSYMLIVGDLKTGRHRVSAKENKQMMLYALGLLRLYRRTCDITAVRLVIFQPYAGGADEWDTTPEVLEQFGKYASAAALRAIDAFKRGKKGLKTADFRPGPDQCQFCRYSEKCGAKTRTARKEDIEGRGAELSDEEIIAEYERLPLLRQHIADTEKAMYKLLLEKGTTGGFKLVEGKMGNRSWTDPEAVIARFGAKVMTESIMTPTAAVKAIPKEELAEFITRKPAQPSIATADDKRPEWRSVGDDDLSD